MRVAEIGQLVDTLLKNVQTITCRNNVEKWAGPKMLQIDAPGRQAGHKDAIKNRNRLFLGGPRTNDRGKQETNASEHGKGPCEKTEIRKPTDTSLKTTVLCTSIKKTGSNTELAGQNHHKGLQNNYSDSPEASTTGP